MDLSTTPIDKLIEYQLALSNALTVIQSYERRSDLDFTSTKVSLIEMNSKIEEAIKDEQFELDKLKEL